MEYEKLTSEAPPAPLPPTLLRRVGQFWRGEVARQIEQRVTLVLACGAILAGLATYGAATGSSALEVNPSSMLLLLYLDLGFLLVFGWFVGKRLVEIWLQRRRGLAGSRLHIRLVVIFGAVAVTPAILMAIFSYLFIGHGMESWFSEKVKTAVVESGEVAQAYLEEHQQNIRADALAAAADFNRQGPLPINPQVLGSALDIEVAARQLTEAVIFTQGNGTRQVLGSSTFSFSWQFEPIPASAVAQAEAGEVVILPIENGDRVHALVRLDAQPDALLYVGRSVAPNVIAYVKTTKEAVDRYNQLENQRSSFQINFILLFGAAAMLLLLVAVWVGLNFATGISQRIRGLVTAAERVRAGDLSARAEERDENDEFGSLRRAFNRMTDHIESQQSELVEANRQLDYRRRFTETVLGGVSAGVIGLDEAGVVTLPNRSAAQLLGLEVTQMIHRPLAELMPEMSPLIDRALEKSERLVNGQIRILSGARPMTLLVRITAEGGLGNLKGYVVTFDDITDLLAAQRTAAWADVARRIAHEIKNPLTPIQLSAERLKRKYLKQITNDPETFQLCTDTIIRQVGDIGRMVDEFSSFARMPTPVMREESLTDIARQVVFLQRTANADLQFALTLPDAPVHIRCDSRQISQALINLVQNAVDSIQTRLQGAGPGAPQGRVAVELRNSGDAIRLIVEDNGKGLPKEGRENLTEPYVTTRTKGTGLGLAIVKKIMEDHAGELVLEDGTDGGARVILVFPVREDSDGMKRERDPMTAAPSSEELAHGA